MPTRIAVYRFGETMERHTGPDARRIRKAVKAEQSQLLARYDRGEPVSLMTDDEIEAEVGRRTEDNQRRAA